MMRTCGVTSRISDAFATAVVDENHARPPVDHYHYLMGVGSGAGNQPPTADRLPVRL